MHKIAGNFAVAVLMASMQLAQAQDVYRAPDGSIRLRTPLDGAVPAGVPVEQPPPPSALGEAPAPRPAQQPSRPAPHAASSAASNTPSHPVAERTAEPVARPSRKIAAGAITDVALYNETGVARSNVPLTFGQVFAPGDLKTVSGLAGRLPDGASVPLQVDVKATHADGSVRHAVVSGVVPALAARGAQVMDIVKAPRLAAGGSGAPTLAELAASGFGATIALDIGGKHYHAAAEDALKKGKPVLWLDGPVVREWLVQAPLLDEAGAAHPHLHARFAVRAYQKSSPGPSGSGKNAAAGDAFPVRVDIGIENDWAFEPGPSNLTYDVDLQVGGRSVYTRKAFVHYHHARWRKVFWTSGAAELAVTHNPAYLIASRAVPNYDQRLTISDGTLQGWKSSWTGEKTEPMSVGLATPYMPTTGGRQDIGILPGWAAAYVLSADPRARAVTLGTGDLSGSWSIHYRDSRTGRPVSVVDYPYMTLLGRQGDTTNPVTKKSEAFPGCGDCKTPNDADGAHQPNFSYLPYLVTGDFYHLEELQFWAMYDLFRSNPGYRDAEKGLLKPDQTRGQAWGLRTLAEAAYITPDADKLKPQLKKFLANNLDWYNAKYTFDKQANPLGAMLEQAMAYDDGKGLAPWQDDFFTQSVGHVADLGFDAARALLQWKVRFAIGRMTAPGYCWVDGAIYKLQIKDGKDAPVYPTFEQAYRASVPAAVSALPCGSAAMASALKLKPGEMTGFSDSTVGFPSNMQPALAYGADVGGEAGARAWKVFEGRSVKPNYASSPQFAIVPRH